jgi:hypothetical protein
LSQTEWAELLGVTERTVRRWETRDLQPHRYHMEHVRELLRRPVLRRRVYMAEDAELLLIACNVVDPIEDSVADYRVLRNFLREIGVLKPVAA